MLCAVIKGPTIEEAQEQLTQAQEGCSLVELRLDFFENLDLEPLKKLRQEFPFPMIFTLRSIPQGGVFKGSEEERLAQLKKLATLKPEYIDLEYPVPPDYANQLKTEYPDTQLIISYHDFQQMIPIAPLLAKLKEQKADLYKIAVMLHSSSEALALLTFMKENQPNVLIMGMGPYGEVTRILSPIFGGKFVYASLEQGLATAPGQLTVKQLHSIYNYDSLTPTTKIYGLIGDPITQSIGYLTHNAVMQAFNLSAVYVNFPVPLDQLADFIKMAKQVGLAGLSVTMPLKEAIVPLVDHLDEYAEKIGCVNTLRCDKDQIYGFNTDGKGAVDALEDKIKVKGKKVVFIGAGGAAKALAKEAFDRGATVLLLNRTHQRALQLAKKIGCQGGPLEQIASEALKGYDVLINATPNSLPVDPEFIIENSVVMDLSTRTKNTFLLKKAKEKNCILIHGYEMFVNQADEQFEIWFGKKIIPKLVKAKLAEIVLNNIFLNGDTL